MLDPSNNHIHFWGFNISIDFDYDLINNQNFSNFDFFLQFLCD